MTDAPRLPEHPPHSPGVPCTDVVAAMVPPPAPTAETKTPTAVDLPVPQTRAGPLSKSEMLNLRALRLLDAAGQKRSEQAVAEAQRVAREEREARLARWEEFNAITAEAHGALVIPEGHHVVDAVEAGETYLVVRPLPEQAKPAASARRGS